MVIWGAFWGAVLGLLWHGHEEGFQALLGLALGAWAGWWLRRAVRREAALAAARVPASTEAARPRAAASAQEDGWDAVPAAAQAASTVAPGSAHTPAAAAEAVLPAGADEAPAMPPAVPLAAASAAQAEPTTPRPPARPDLVTQAITRARDWLLGGNTVVRMGVLVLFIGLAFLAKYAVDNALLPPELRLALVGAAGIALFVTGFRLARRDGRAAYALTLQGAGVAVLYLTVFAAFRLYQFLPAGAAFAALGLVCAFSAAIALAQNAQAMAFIGFAGGFAAPILVSTGQGNHVALFTYYTLLGAAILGIGWFRPWRALNVLGFVATFVVASAWGVLSYRPEHYASTQPFLLGFFLLYLAASLVYGLRPGQGPRQAVDGTLVFGVPIAAFGLQAALTRDTDYATAFSALALGALYLGLAAWLARRRGAREKVARWLAQCFVALGIGFATLAVPLALDQRWTSAVWAVEGAAVYWMARRQDRWLARAFGLALQGFAALLFLADATHTAVAGWPFAHPQFIGATLLAGAAFAIAWWSRQPLEAPPVHAWSAGLRRIEASLSPLLFWAGFLWWQFALHSEIGRAVADGAGIPQPVLGARLQDQLKLLAWVGSAFALHHLALPARRAPWPIAATPAWTVLPFLLLAALGGMALHAHVFQAGGWLAWPLALLLHAVMLRRLDGGTPAPWWPWVHAGGVWLLVLLAGNLLVFAIGRAQLWQTAWATVILLVAGTGVLLLLARRRGFLPQGQGRWPLDRFARAYLWRAAAPLAVLLVLAALAVAVHSSGEARPLPYVPLLNPTDLAVALALAATGAWLARLRATDWPLPPAVRGPVPLLVLAAVAFIALNTVWLRVAHHYAAVPWDAGALFDSFLVQAGYSILWTLLALGLMLAAHRRAHRRLWMAGAGLLGLTVLKLFVIDLSNRGGSERIVVFIAVGLLMLVVGYLTPLPPAAREAEAAGGAQA